MTRIAKNQLSMIVAQVIDRRQGERRMSPSWIAVEAAREIDPFRINEKTMPNFHKGFVLGITQVAREQLRARFETASDPNETTQHKLFPELQAMYPIVRSPGDEPIYVILEDLTDEDIDWNAERLEREAKAKIRHAEALRFYKSRRTAQAAE